jgi:hypothetical protein
LIKRKILDEVEINGQRYTLTFEVCGKMVGAVLRHRDCRN